MSKVKQGKLLEGASPSTAADEKNERDVNEGYEDWELINKEKWRGRGEKNGEKWRDTGKIFVSFCYEIVTNQLPTICYLF